MTHVEVSDTGVKVIETVERNGTEFEEQWQFRWKSENPNLSGVYLESVQRGEETYRAPYPVFNRVQEKLNERGIYTVAK